MSKKSLLLAGAVVGACLGLTLACGDDSGADPKKDGGGGSAGQGGAAGAGGNAGAAGQTSYDACSSDGWCWESPLPQGNHLYGAWASSENDIWVVGARGTALHFDGTGWQRSEVGTAEALRAVWGSGPNDVWAVGDEATVVHFDGSVWSTVDVGGPEAGAPKDFFGIYGRAQDNFLVVGEGGVILHYTGSWNTPTSPTANSLRSVWVAEDGQAWAVGDYGARVHFDGTDFKLQPAYTPINHLRAVHGSGPDNVMVAGQWGFTVHFDGTKWTPKQDKSLGAYGA
ncbi:MAG TPA: hypothetical protein PKD61_31230, partial [Polyangiaceae bacterium]|nr:hypothetical protein [Polyangiaceae bacterium]